MIVLPLGALFATAIAFFIPWAQPLVNAREGVCAASRMSAAPDDDQAQVETRELESLPAEDRVLDKEQLKRLRVTWGKPRRWVDVENERDPYLQVSGRLSLLQADGKTLKPVDWPYPIRVVIALKPNKKLDWSRRHDFVDSDCCDTLIGRDSRNIDKPLSGKLPGVFTASFSLDGIESPVGSTKPFQVGLCFGVKKGKKVTWSNVVPILPQSVAMLDVTGPKPLSRTLQLINACPTPIGWNYDPIALVRAANHLQSLGKDKAIAALREYTDVARWGGFDRPRFDPENIDTSSEYCLAGLVPLVFDGVSPYGCIRVWQGIPFHTVVFLGNSGNTLRAGRDMVEAAAEKGMLRKLPLRPTDNPLESADSLFEKIAPPKDKGQRWLLQAHLRGQTLRAIRHLVDPEGKQEPDLTSQATWEKLKAKAARLKIRWDEKRQEYVAGEKSK
jgi:hypothetical protein